MSAPESVRLALRRETAALHTELDTLLSQTDFDDQKSYARFLMKQAAPLFAIEAAIDASDLPTLFADWDTRRRSDAIRQDLSRLSTTAPQASRFVAIGGNDALLGALYVLEGSRLGAKFLVRQAHASRDPVVRKATRYLGHGEGHGFWPSYLAALARREATGLDRRALSAGACAAFALFLDAAAADAVGTQSVPAPSA